MISNRIHRNFIILSNIHSLLKCFLWSEVFLLRNNLFKWESKQDLFIVFRNYVTTFFLIYNSLYLHLPLPLSFISLRNTYILTVECCIFWIWPIVSFWCSLTCSSFPAISFILIGRCGEKWVLSFNLSLVWLSVTPWAVSHGAPLSIEFFRQEY